MRKLVISSSLLLILFLSSCGERKRESLPSSIAAEDLKAADTPILSLKEGDFWKYKVMVEVPPGVTSEGASAIEIEQVKMRVYKGKVFVAEGLPEVDAFDISVPGQALERELVEIHADKIMMRGTTRPDVSDAKPVWLDPAVPFVTAGLRAGEELAKLGVQDGARTRGVKVVAREDVEVPAGKFAAIRLLMTGNDGQFELRRTTWFVPRIGIVKEEKARYAANKLLFRETTELVETNVTGLAE